MTNMDYLTMDAERADAFRARWEGHRFRPGAEADSRLLAAFGALDALPALPDSLRQPPHVAEMFSRDDCLVMPPWWGLRPDPSLTMESLLEQVAELPRLDAAKIRALGLRGDMFDGCPEPQVLDRGRAPFGTFFLREDKRGRAFDDFEHRERAIRVLDDNTWSISGLEPFQDWKFGTSANPNVEWYMEGIFYKPGRDGGRIPGQLTELPGSAAPGPYQPVPTGICSVSIDSASVFGSAWIILKRLGFWGALDVAINYIELQEWAYGVAGWPAWAPGPAGTDPLPEPPSASLPAPAAPVVIPLAPAPAAPQPPAVDDEPDELQQVLDKVAAARKAAKGNIARAADRRAAADELRAEAEAAEAAALAAERDAEPQRQVLRDEAGRLLELLKADEDFPGIA